MGHYVVLAGIPAAGKTVMARILEERAGFKAFLEDHQQNAYHSDFARLMGLWAFHNEVEFLLTAGEAQREINSLTARACQDGSIYQYFHVFIKYLYESRHLDHREYETLRRLYSLLEQVTLPPDLLVTLDVSPEVCLSRVRQRSRTTDEEVGIDLAFLEDMHRIFEAWLGSWSDSPVLRIDSEELDFVHDSMAQEYAIEQILGRLAYASTPGS